MQIRNGYRTGKQWLILQKGAVITKGTALRVEYVSLLHTVGPAIEESRAPLDAGVVPDV